jgi:hypothetical protein
MICDEAGLAHRRKYLKPSGAAPKDQHVNFTPL